MCVVVCVGGVWPPCTGRALRSISASKFHLKETKAHRDRTEKDNSGGLAHGLESKQKVKPCSESDDSDLGQEGSFWNLFGNKYSNQKVFRQ